MKRAAAAERVGWPCDDRHKSGFCKIEAGKESGPRYGAKLDELGTLASQVDPMDTEARERLEGRAELVEKGLLRRVALEKLSKSPPRTR